MIDVARYPLNLWIWFKRLFTVRQWFDEDGLEFTLRKRLVFYLFWTFDVLPNMLTGGDPEESLSSRFHKDRHAWLPGLIINIVEGVTSKDHGKRSLNPYFGEGGLNRELSNPGQVMITFIWGATILFWAI